jgi:cell division protein ZapA
MGQISVIIDGKSYRMACDDGQEDHLTALAAYYDARVQDMHASFGEIGDMRLAVMAAITLADEINELKRKLGSAETALDEAKQSIAGFDAAAASREDEIAETVGAVADRVERIAKSLATG